MQNLTKIMARQLLKMVFNYVRKSWKTRPEYFSKFQFPGVTQNDFWKTDPYLDGFSINRPVLCPKILKLMIG